MRPAAPVYYDLSQFHKNNIKKKQRLRSLTVKYYENVNDIPDDYVAQGYPKSEAGVIKGAMVRLFMGQYAMARIFKDKTCTMTIIRRPDGLPEARFGPHVLGRVKPDGSIEYSEGS